ncbi:MAG: transglutaminase-like domain-containing protein [Isosphaeraceae bacterium]
MRSLQRTVLVLALVLLANGRAHAAPRVRDVWHCHVADGKRYGYVHTVVTRLPDGNFRITQESRVLIDLMGANKEETTERGEYVVAADYRPVSIAVEGKRESGATKIIGRSRGAKFEVTVTVAGIERSGVFDRPESILLEPCLDDWLADRPTGFAAGEVTLLDEESCTLKPAKVERLGARPGQPGISWSVDSGPLDRDGRLVLDAEGVRLERSAAGGLVVIRRFPAEQARDIAYRKMDGRDILMYPLDKEVGPPEFLESLTVELKWKDIPFERFRLEDDRQHVVERSHEGNQYRAVVRIEAPRPLTTPAKLPIAGPEFAPYLGESRFIKPHDERIVAVAREVTRGKTDSLEAVKALGAWIVKNVEAALISETLTGPEVLACRKGKCSEFAILFASMARAVGIPTRIVLGDRMIPGYWGGHMWNEAYVGRWIPVDAGANEVGTSFVLLKLIDHETVEGTQPLRQALPASFAIAIKDHRSKRSPLAGKFKTGIVGRAYTNAELGCRMTAPGDDWSIEEVKEPGAAVIRFKVPEKGKGDIQLHFVAFSLPVPLDPKMLLALRRKHYEKNVKGFEVVADEANPVNKLAGHRLEFRATPGSGKPRHAFEVIWRTPSAGFLLALNAEVSVYEEGKASFDKLLASFEDLGKK